MLGGSRFTNDEAKATPLFRGLTRVDRELWLSGIALKWERSQRIYRDNCDMQPKNPWWDKQPVGHSSKPPNYLAPVDLLFRALSS